MLNTLCAAGVNASDITVLVILVLGIVAGIVIGFAKMLNGALGGIIAFVASVCLGFFLAGYLANVSVFGDLQTKVNDFLVSKIDITAYNAKVADGELLLDVGGGDWTSIVNFYESSSKVRFAALLQSACVKLFSSSLTGDITLGAFAAGLIVKLLCGIIIFIVALIVLEILFSILSSILTKIAEKQKALRSVDRVFGFIFSAAFTVVVIFVVMFIVSKLGANAGVVGENIEASTVAKWFYENNPFLLL